MNQKVAKIFTRLILSDKKIRIKLIGDSITHGVGGTGWEQNGEKFIENFASSPKSYSWANLLRDFLEQHYNCEVINNGCSGINIEYVIRNFNTLIDDEDDIIICTIGTNNRQQRKNGNIKSKQELSNYFYNRILELNDVFKENGRDYVLVANIPASPENEKGDCDFYRTLHMSDIHDLYVKAFCEADFPFIDLYSSFIAYCDLKNIDYNSLLADGLHPNDAGYDVIFKLLLREFGLGKNVIK